MGYERSDSLPGCRAAPSPNDWGRTAGAPGAWREVSRMGGSRTAVGRDGRPPLVETLEFPEAVGQELTLRRGLGVLVDGLLARPNARGARRELALWARLVGGASWRRTVTLREPTADPARLRLALGPKLAELPAPVLELRLEVVELAEQRGEQLELVRAEGERAAGPVEGGPAPGEGGRRRRRGLDGRGGGTLVTYSGSTRAARTPRRLKRPGRRSSKRTPTAPAPGQPAGRCDRPRGVANRRPLVDGGARRPALLRPGPRDGRERRRLPRRRAGAWFTQRA